MQSAQLLFILQTFGTNFAIFLKSMWTTMVSFVELSMPPKLRFWRDQGGGKSTRKWDNPNVIHHLRCIPDNRQFRRELEMLTPARQADGYRIAWTDVEQHGGVVVVTPRLCYG